MVAAGMGRSDEAFAAFAEVRSRFAELGMPYDAALATLQLAVLYAAEGGRSAEVKALAAEAAPIFRAEGIHPEARKALALFARVAAEERVTVELARAVAGFVERARREPGARFEGFGVREQEARPVSGNVPTKPDLRSVPRKSPCSRPAALGACRGREPLDLGVTGGAIRSRVGRRAGHGPGRAGRWRGLARRFRDGRGPWRRSAGRALPGRARDRASSR